MGKTLINMYPVFPVDRALSWKLYVKKSKLSTPTEETYFRLIFLRSNSKTRRTTLTKIVSQSKHTNTFYAFTRE